MHRIDEDTDNFERDAHVRVFNLRRFDKHCTCSHKRRYALHMTKEEGAQFVDSKSGECAKARDVVGARSAHII